MAAVPKSQLRPRFVGKFNETDPPGTPSRLIKQTLARRGGSKQNIAIIVSAGISDEKESIIVIINAFAGARAALHWRKAACTR